MLLRKLSFLHLLFLQHKNQTSEKTTGQFFFTKQKPTCKIKSNAEKTCLKFDAQQFVRIHQFKL